MFTKVTDHTQEYENAKQKLSWTFGLVGGFAFVLFAWGISTIQLAFVNGIYPWAKLLLGFLPVMALCAFTGWLSYRVKNALVSALCWMVCGFVITYIACHISFEGLKWFYGLINPTLASIIDYPFTSGVSARLAISIIVSVVALGIAGSLYNILLENAFAASAKVGLYVSLIIWAVFFAASAQTFNNLLDRPMRDPVAAINQVIDYRKIDASSPFDDETARNLHIHALNGVDNISTLIYLPRKIVMQGYDDTITMIKVAVNFSGTWATCNVIADNTSEPPKQQIVFCRNLEIPK